MKLIAIPITNNSTTYYRVQPLFQAVLYVFVPFDKNTLGDIIALRDERGRIVATYEYDAWGNHTVTDRYGNVNTNSTFIGNINPFRYRGYYYDTETGFYYLQTRKHSVTSRVRIFGLTSFRLILLVKIKSTILEYFLHYQFYTYKKVPTE